MGWNELDFETNRSYASKIVDRYHVSCGWIFGYKPNGRIIHIKVLITFLIDPYAAEAKIKRQQQIRYDYYY